VRAISQGELLADAMLRIGLCDGESACQTLVRRIHHMCGVAITAEPGSPVGVRG
jgi:hypothetical protein